MAVDRVRALKMESPTRGTELDEFPTGLNPSEDHLEARGLHLQNDTSDDELVYLTRSSNQLVFKDDDLTAERTLQWIRTLQNLYTGAEVAGKTPQTDGAGGITLADVVSGYPPAFASSTKADLLTTTLFAWQEAYSVTTPSLDLGSYIVFVQAIMSGSKSNSQYEVRAQFDGADKGLQNAQAGVPFSEQLFFTHSIQASISGAHTIDIDYRKVSGSGYVSIRGMIITYWRVSAS